MNLSAVVLFAFVAGITPGPNNTLLLHSGARYGYRRTLPHILGICVGMSMLFLSLGMGLGDVNAKSPWLEPILYALATLLIAYMATRMALIPFPDHTLAKSTQPWGFDKALLFQWVNPKIWMMAMGVFGAHAGTGGGWGNVLAITSVFSGMCLATMSFWALGGLKLSKWLESPRSFRVFHQSLALFLAASWSG